MSGPILTPALVQLRADFDAAFPSRDKESDGWIGDTAHQATTSDHNPDDTAGVRAGQFDTDGIPEVRAVDVDADLRDSSGITMYDVIKRILATPADLARLKYIIFCPPVGGPFGDNVPTIWSRSTNWEPRRYDGVSPHREHAHLSGYAPTDDSNAPWSVAQMGNDMTPAQQYIQHVMNYRIDAILHMRPTCNVPAFTASDGSRFPAITETNHLAAFLLQLDAGAPGAPVDLAALVDATADEVTKREAAALRAGADKLEAQA